MWVVNTSALTGFTYKRIDWELCPSMISTDDLSKYKNNLWHYSLFSKTDGKRHLNMDVSSSPTVNHWEWNKAACSFKKSNTTGFPMLSYSQQSRPSIFPVKLTKRIKMLQVTFTKYADRREKYILVCLWQQKPPPKSAAILLNWRSTQVLQKGLWLLESGRKRNICCLHHTSDSSLAQSKYSPSKVPTLATRG